MDMPDLDLDGERPVKSEFLAVSKMYHANLRLRQGLNPSRDLSKAYSFGF